MGRNPAYWLVNLALFFFSTGYEPVNNTTESNMNILSFRLANGSWITHKRTVHFVEALI
jgi:hypothetical protein